MPLPCKTGEVISWVLTRLYRYHSIPGKQQESTRNVTLSTLRFLASDCRGRIRRSRISYRHSNVEIVIECGLERRYFPQKIIGTRWSTRKKWEQNVTLNPKKVTKSNTMESVVRSFRITADFIVRPSYSDQETVTVLQTMYKHQD